MMGQALSDPEQVEEGGTLRGMGLFPGRTVFGQEKVRGQVSGTFGALEGIFCTLSGKAFHGNEIHMGCLLYTSMIPL